MFKELISFESDNLKEIKIAPRVTRLLRDTGTLISKSNLLKSIDDTNFKYCHHDGSYCTIDMEHKDSLCAWYLDRGIRKHLVAACIKT